MNKSLQPFTGKFVPASTAVPAIRARMVAGRLRRPVIGTDWCNVVAPIAVNPYRRHYVE
jgi:hypothetical protein